MALLLDTPRTDTHSDELTELAEAIAYEHRLVVRRGREMLEHAIACGEALLKARAKCRKGAWLYWFENHVEGLHITTAHRYMRLADHKDQVLASDVETIDGAMRELADLPRRDHGPRAYTEADRVAWIALAEEHGVKPAARMLGVSPATMFKWASPNGPMRNPSHPKAPSKRIGINDQMIERMATWLHKHYGDPRTGVTDTWRDLALDALGAALRGA